MRRIDLGVFDPADRTPDGSLDGERRQRDNEIGDLVRSQRSSVRSCIALAADNAPPV